MTELCGKFQRNSDLTAADYLVFPVHKPGHWIIIIADIQHKQVLLFDPLSSGGEDIPSALKMAKCYLDFVSVSRDYFGAFEGFRCSEGHPIQGDSISCGLFCLLYAYSIIHGVAMNLTQVDMPVFRKRMAFDILSGKTTEPLGRDWRGLEKNNSTKKRKELEKPNSHCSIKCVARA